jgi:hypothetical protein
MAGVAFAVEGDGVGFATESYAASALYTTLANLSADLWRIRWARYLLAAKARSGLRSASIVKIENESVALIFRLSPFRPARDLPPLSIGRSDYFALKAVVGADASSDATSTFFGE